MNEKDYINQIKKLSNKKLIRKYVSLLNELEKNETIIRSLTRLMNEEKNSKDYKNLYESIHSRIDASNEYRGKLNHLVFEIVNKRKISGLDDIISKEQRF